MANETTRIVNLPQASEVSDGLNFVVDSVNGTKRSSAADVADYVLAKATPDTTLAVSGKPADAKATGDALDTKVDKVTGKGLSTEDYTTEEKTKLSGIATGATNVVIDDTLAITGQAADAKKTGDEISDLKEDLSALGLSVVDGAINVTYTV